MKKAPDSQRRRVCKQCSVVFYVKPSRKTVYCSIGCRAESMRIRPKTDPRPCVVCGEIFKPSRGCGEARFCSKSCEWVALKGPEFNARIARETAKARGDKLRGTGKTWYVKLNGRHKHRVVAENALGRKLRPGEVVHHKDGNKKNNNPDNLQVMTQGEHMRVHGLGIPGMTLWWKPWEKRWGRE